MEKINFRFQVSGNIIKKFGRESISNKNIAILELIKNSFDAGSTKVTVDFENIDTSDIKLKISDNGQGMNYNDIQNKWMLIATPNKSKKFKEEDRVLVGEKGIGRLSSECLGEKTNLITFPKKELFGYKILFDWKKYDNEDILVNDVINEGEKILNKKKEHGTIIEINKLRHNWNDNFEIKKLLKDIYLIHPPNKSFKNFNIITPFSRKLNDLIKPRKSIFDNAAYKLKVRLTGGNKVFYEFTNFNKKKKSNWMTIDKKLTCGDLVFELFFYYKRERDYESRFGKHLPSLEMNKVDTFLKEYSGIKLYRDNFRVKPFGEDGNDWIGIDPLSLNNPSIIPRNFQVFGMVHISRLKNPLIKDVTTREGIDFNDAARDMVNFIQWVITQLWVELRSEAEPDKKKARKTIKIIKSEKSRKSNFQIPSTIPVEVKEKSLIEVRGKYPQIFYDDLEEEINICCEHNHSNAAFFLTRKFIENLILDILIKKFPNNQSLWWSTQYGYHLNLSPLIHNLYVNRKDFKPYAKDYIEKFNEIADKFRNETNNSAHNLHDYLSDKSELNTYKIKDMIQLLINIYNSI
ncbi:MAG: ATP-binding protein [Candidatus Nanoarchaeia archaeon]|nr:ATP-binding protein [Candidatus Nanoarchaeia archaeon]